jgi:hypothetical protein
MSEQKDKTSEKADFPAPKAMQGWLEREIADIARAAELRIKDATRFVNTYARGELSADEAAKQSLKYADRWGEALPGVPRSAGLNDDEILKRIDETRDPNFVNKFARRNLDSERKRGS